MRVNIDLGTVEQELRESISQLAGDFSSMLHEGFQCIVEITDSDIEHENNLTDFHDPKHPWCDPTFFRLHIVHGIRGSFAEAKMETLHHWTNSAATGQMNLQELLQMIECHPSYNEDDLMLQEIQQLEDVSQLLRRHHEWLRNKFKITVFPGGIRIPVQAPFHNFRGEVRIAFSALTAEEDVAMCVQILHLLQQAIDRQANHAFAWDYSELKQIPMVNFHLIMQEKRHNK